MGRSVALQRSAWEFTLEHLARPRWHEAERVGHTLVPLMSCFQSVSTLTAALFLFSCTDAVIQQGPANAGPDPDGGADLDDPSSRLLGYFAVRSTYSARSAAAALTYEEILFARVRASGADGALTMTLRPCRWLNRAEGADPFISLGADLAEMLMPSRTLRVSTQNCEEHPNGCWSAVANENFSIGYDEANNSYCRGKAGQTIAASWVSWAPLRRCTCPQSESAPIASDQQEDCRIGDPDGDDAPGFTVGFAQGLGRAMLAYQANSSYISGWVDDDGTGKLFAREQREETFSYLSCTPAAICYSDSRLCPAEQSLVEFVPLDEVDFPDSSNVNGVCRDILKHMDELWPGERPSPPGCATVP